LTGERVERRLAAVLAADVAGYSRLMGLDEEGTLARLKAVRKALVDPAIAGHRGRIVKTTGDGMLVEFASAVDAARCAMEVQRGMAKQNIDVPQEAGIEFRIGIHVGDIIIDDNDIFGDGVNIAARLEGIAEPGGVCISDDTYRQVRDRIDAAFHDKGEIALKNIARPVRVFALAGAKQPATKVIEPAPALALPDKPSIAVLPLSEHERRSGARIFRRWNCRGHHYRAVTLQIFVGKRAQFVVHLQRESDRYQASWARTWCALCAGRQCS
jgi:adenylate cyclase